MDMIQIIPAIVSAFLIGVGSVAWRVIINLQKMYSNMEHITESHKIIVQELAKILTTVNLHNTDIVVLQTKVENIIAQQKSIQK